MIWVTILGMAIITFVNRYAFLARTLTYRPSAKVRRFLGFSSYAVLTAIWTPIVFSLESGMLLSHAGWDYLLAAALAAILTLTGFASIIVVLLSTSVFFLLRFLF